MDIRPKRKTGAYKCLELRRRRRRYVDNGHRIGLAHVGIAEPGDRHVAACGGALRAVHSFGARESKGGKWNARPSVVLRIGAGNDMIRKHADVGHVEPSTVRRQRERER